MIRRRRRRDDGIIRVFSCETCGAIVPSWPGRFHFVDVTSKRGNVNRALCGRVNVGIVLSEGES